MKNVFYSGHLDKRRERTSDKKYVPPKNEVKSVAVLQCCNAFLTKLLKMKKKSPEVGLGEKKKNKSIS